MRILSILSLVILFSLSSFTTSDDKWVEFKPEGGGCIVILPGVPTKEEQIVKTDVGELNMQIYAFQPESESDDNKVYHLIYTDYPEGVIHPDSADIIKTFFDNSRDGSIASVQGRLISESNVSIDGYPGREISIDFKNGLAIIRQRMYLVKNRLYVLQVITLTEKSSNVSIDKFLDSFKLTK